ncbi:MAG: hypothetical protein ACR2JS_08075 [Candidatus Nanopelagicales bacterium]
MSRRNRGRALSPEELKAKRKRDFWTLDLPLIFGLALCTTFTVIEAVRGFDGNGRALAYAFQWPTIGAIIIWIWYRYKREGLPAAEDDDQAENQAENPAESPAGPTTLPRKRRSLGFADHYKARIEEAGAEYAAALHAADEVDRAPVIPESDEGLREWKAYVADLNRREPPGHPPSSST